MSNQALAATIKKNPVSFGCAALSCVLIAIIYFRGDLMAQAETLLAEKSAEGEKINLNIQYSAQLKEQTESVEAAVKTIESRIVRASQLGTNTQYFYRIESETGAKIIDLRQTTPATAAKPAKGTYLPVAFAVSVQGDLTKILDFLRHLENGAHYCRVLNATCSGNTSTRTTPLTLALTLELLGTP
jgi:hypothetical protein